MQTSSQSECPPVSDSPLDCSVSSRSEDLAYQVVTIAAILLLLGSLGVF